MREGAQFQEGARSGKLSVGSGIVHLWTDVLLTLSEAIMSQRATGRKQRHRSRTATNNVGQADSYSKLMTGSGVVIQVCRLGTSVQKSHRVHPYKHN